MLPVPSILPVPIQEYSAKLTERSIVTYKSKRTDDLILTKDVTAEMRAYLAKKEPQNTVFNLVYDLRTMIKKDEADACIEYRDAAGRDLDFHSLRYTFCTKLAPAGIYITVAQKMMRHSTVELTAKFYTNILHEFEVAAIEALENLTKTFSNPEKMKTNMDKSGQVNYNSNVKMAIAS